MSGEPRQIGRYAMYGVLASGGMATVHLGRLAGAAGFARIVAIKALRPQYAEDPEFVSMFIDEARLAARIHHPNVVPTLDVVSNENELFTVMDYVHGETLSRLMRATRGTPIPLGIITAVMRDVLHGLHAAHEATDEHGQSLGVVHRDVSPQNIIVGADGVARVLDFGVAKAAGRIQTTREGQLKGKIAYMAPEQYHGAVSRQTDVFAASVVLWEVIVGDKLFSGNEGEIVAKILHRPIPAPHEKRPEITPELDAIVMRGLEREPDARFKTALEISDALVNAHPPASSADVGTWVASLVAETLKDRQALIREMETEPRISQNSVTAIKPVPKAEVTATSVSAVEREEPKSRLALAIVLGLGAIVILVFAAAHLRHAPADLQPTALTADQPTSVTPAMTDPPIPEASEMIRALPPSTSTAAVPVIRPISPNASTHKTPVKPAHSAATTDPDHI